MAITSNYAGKVAQDIMLKAIKEEDTLRLGLLNVVPDVNYKLNLRNLDVTLNVQDYSCGTTPSTDSIEYSEKVLEIAKFKNEFEICKEDFRPVNWDNDMGASAWNESPESISEAIIADTVAKLGQWVEDQIWNGAGTANTMNGLLAQFTADADVVKPAAAGAIDKSNVMDAFDLVTLNIPTALRRKDVQFIISPDVADAYAKSLIEAGAANGFGGNANTAMVYGRYTVQTVNGLPNNTIVIFAKENITFATGLADDATSIRTKDMDEVDFSGNVLYKSVFGMAVGYAFGSEIVFYQGA